MQAHRGKLHYIEMSIRGIQRGFSLKVGPTTRRTYAARIRELSEGHPTLEAIAAPLLKVRDACSDEFAEFERKLSAIARQDDNARRLMTTLGVSVLVTLTLSAVDAPERFRSGGAVGPRFGLTGRSTNRARPIIAAASRRSAIWAYEPHPTRQPTSSLSDRSKARI